MKTLPMKWTRNQWGELSATGMLSPLPGTMIAKLHYFSQYIWHFSNLVTLARKDIAKQSEFKLHKKLAYAVERLTAEKAQRLWVRTDTNKTTVWSINQDAITFRCFLLLLLLFLYWYHFDPWTHHMETPHVMEKLIHWSDMLQLR